MSSSGQAFEGVRVVDAASNLAGPYAAMFLSDHGADVVKVESPSGDPHRSQPGFQLLNRGKRSIVLDATTEAGAAGLAELAARADVLLTSDSQPRLGLDARALRAANPLLIAVSVAPFGERGPLAGHAWSPAAVAAASGIMDVQASYGGEPVTPVVPAASYGAGVLAATAIAAALFARERDGRGRSLEVSELAGALAMQLGTVSSQRVSLARARPPLLGPRGPVLPFALYEAGDGGWFFLACATREFFDRMLLAIDRPDLAAAARFRDAPWGELPEEARAELQTVLEQTFRRQAREHWLRRFAEADVPAQPVQSRDAFLDSELVRANGLCTTLEHPSLGELTMPAVALTIESAPGQLQGRAPLLGEHTAEVLAELAAAPPCEPAAAPAGAPRPLLDGVAVVDASSYIAGPSAARHLAALGAAVVKVESPRGDPFRVLNLGFQGWNLGKRSIALDLAKARGREVLARLLGRADVLVENARPATAAAIGLDRASVAQANATLLHVSIGGLGDDPEHRDLPAFDPLLQALTGAMDAQGGDGEPVYGSVALADAMAALLAAFGACAALYRRARSGDAAGGVVRTTLTQAVMAAQAGELVRYAGAPAPARGGRDFAGPSASERAYCCGDGGWLLIEARTAAERAALARAVGVELDAEALAGGADGPAARALAARLADRTRADWIADLEAARVPCIELTARHELFDAEHLRANRLVRRLTHPLWGGIAAPGLLVRDRGVRDPLLGRAPLRSEHATEILEELGYLAASEQRALLGDGAVGVARLDLPAGEDLEEFFRAGRVDGLPISQLVYLFSMDVG